MNRPVNSVSFFPYIIYIYEGGAPPQCAICARQCGALYAHKEGLHIRFPSFLRFHIRLHLPDLVYKVSNKITKKRFHTPDEKLFAAESALVAHKRMS